ncbi:Replication termination factor 2 [Coniochaeta hoffmannii]|uniref:Replication termination factor 2 n=1 Tax=Coniochaeta hoffmannii TaxID=91930 RepID=A0AA38S3J2_9PEZI|nr:Replication termination factor 2 [Coniochaeta hoffmannii]
MGNDGGSIPTRRELVKSASRAPTVSEMKATALESLAHAWTHDPLTSDTLDMDNIVSDWRGRLYNYETILKNLMPSSDDDGGDGQTPPTLVNTANGEWRELTFASTGIKSLRDVVKLKFKRYKPAGEKEILACPMTLKELGPATKAVYLAPCGHVFAEVAVKTIQEDICPECGEKFKVDDVVPILPTEKAEVERLVKRIESLREGGLTHSLKKDKSQGKKKRKAEDGANGSTESKKTKKDADARSRKTEHGKTGKEAIASRVSGINNPMTASLTAKVLAEQEEHNKRRKLAAAR